MSAQPIDLLLVDGSSYLFRAYHALPPLTNSKGVPTGAMYGVLNMLKKLLTTYQPTYAAVLFDTKAKTFRHELFADYKANRPAMPEELAVQIAPLFEAIKALGWPLVAIEGVEADDVIATLAHHAIDKSKTVIVSTGDKDLAQIVDERVTLINTMNNELLDIHGVIKKFGVPPERITDYLALIGDKVDNVPGVPKVGPKTALKWLTQYESLAGVIEHAEEITGKVGESLRAHLNSLPLSRELVKVKYDVELPIDFDSLTMSAPDTSMLINLFKEYEFKNWLKDLSENASVLEDKVVFNKTDYTIINDKNELKQWIELIKKAQKMAFDLETTSLNPLDAQIVGISLAYECNQACYIPVGHHDSSTQQLDLSWVLGQLVPLLKDESLTLIGQNLKYDLAVLKQYDISLNRAIFDTMLMSYVINSTTTRHDMDSLAQYYLNYSPISYEEVAGKGAKQINFADVSIEKASQYAAEDADVTLSLFEKLYPTLNDSPRLLSLYQEIESPLVSVLCQMESQGVKVDAKLLKNQSEYLAKRVAELEAQVYCLSGEQFNLSSPKQLQAILFEKLHLPILEKTPKGQPSTAEHVLQELGRDFELPRLILEYRSLSKLISTYTDRLPEQIHPRTQRIHTSYHQAVTATGRLSSSDPNLQNIPIRTDAGRKIRKAFIAESGYRIIAADYSQIELRIMAHLSKDRSLINAFKEDKDIHQATASELFNVELNAVTSEQRRRAKAINFGLIYGMSAYGLAKQLEISQREAAEYMEIYFERYPGVKHYMEETRARAAEKGYVETLMGRRLYLPDINAKQVPRRKAAERAAINAPMQGTAADIIKKAMIDLYQWQLTCSSKIFMVMQVHDELVFEVENSFIDEALTSIKNKMESALTLDVPLIVGIGVGDNWDEAH